MTGKRLLTMTREKEASAAPRNDERWTMAQKIVAESVKVKKEAE
jgi:hypothetical protein